ncbi:MAG: glycosyltransferase family 39 protein [Patescibacteria group bacterium]
MNQFYKIHKKEIFLFLLMLILELAMIFVLSQKNDLGIFSRNDANEFQNIVKNLISRQTFSLDSESPFYPTNFRTPIYPFWLAIIYLIFSSFKPAIFIGAAIFALSAPLVYLIAKEIFSEKIALASAVLFAIEPWALFQSGFLVAEQIFMPMFLLSAYLFCRYLKLNKHFYLYCASFLLGVTALIRPIALFFISVFLFLIFLLELKTSTKSAFKYSALSLLVFVLVLSPWLIRNKIVLNTWKISSISDVNLYIENYAMLEKYLGKMKQNENINEMGRILLGTKNYEEAKKTENAKILADVALEEIKTNFSSYIVMHLSNLPSFLFKNSYGNIFFDLKIGDSGVQSKISKYFFKKDFSDLSKLVENSAISTKILILFSFFWPAVMLFAIVGAVEGFKNYRLNLLFWFLILWILYFLALAGNLRDISRYKLAINAPLFIFSTIGLSKVYKYFLKAYNN